MAIYLIGYSIIGLLLIFIVFSIFIVILQMYLYHRYTFILCARVPLCSTPPPCASCPSFWCRRCRQPFCTCLLYLLRRQMQVHPPATSPCVTISFFRPSKKAFSIPLSFFTIFPAREKNICAC